MKVQKDKIIKKQRIRHMFKQMVSATDGVLQHVDVSLFFRLHVFAHQKSAKGKDGENDQWFYMQQ